MVKSIRSFFSAIATETVTATVAVTVAVTVTASASATASVAAPSAPMTAAASQSQTSSKMGKTSWACLAPEALKKYEVAAQSATASYQRLSKSAASSDSGDSRVKQALREGQLVKRVPLTSAAEETSLTAMLKDSDFVNLLDCPDLKKQIDSGETAFLPAGAVVIYKVGEKKETAIRTPENCNEDANSDSCAIPVKKKYLAIYVKRLK